MPTDTPTGTPTTDLIDRALEQAFMAQVAQLFAVLCTASRLDDGMDKFELGLDKTIRAYEATKTRSRHSATFP